MQIRDPKEIQFDTESDKPNVSLENCATHGTKTISFYLL